MILLFVVIMITQIIIIIIIIDIPTKNKYKQNALKSIII